MSGRANPPGQVVGQVLGMFNRGLVFGAGFAVAVRWVWKHT